LEYLTHSSLIPTFHEEVLETLVRHAKQADMTLPLAYYHTMQPTLKSCRAVESLFLAIAQASVVEAFYFARGQADIPRRQMFETLIASVLSSPAGERTAKRATELVNLPFTQEEERWFEVYLTVGDGKGLKRANDTLMIWKIGTCRFKEALSVSISGGKPVNTLSWEAIVSGLQEGLGSRS
jgi:Nuclear pore complex assembly